MTAEDAQARRAELTELAMRLIAEKGAAISKAELANAARLSRSRIDALFPEEQDLFAAIVDAWYTHDDEDMREVVACTLPIERKFYEFFARRFRRERERYRHDPALFALYVELGQEHFEQVRGYIDLADHYLTELIAQAQDEGHFEGLDIDRVLSLINQMVVCYTSPQMMMIIDERLSEEKLAAIIDTVFAGLTARVGETARAVSALRSAD